MRSLRAARMLVAVAAAGMVSFAAAGCTASSPTASPTTATSTLSGSVTSPPAAPSTVHAAPAVAVQQLQFPNASATVVFTGYDTKDKMVEFQKVVQNPAKPTADLIPDPKDPAVHRLALAPGTNVTSIDPNGFPFETCPPVHCTADDIIQSVMSRMTLWANIHVNAADQINVVNQSAY
ncbi:MAG TPA: hypothetical protein VGM75_18715 [Pseudonocardiaceae bacterium]